MIRTRTVEKSPTMTANPKDEIPELFRRVARFSPRRAVKVLAEIKTLPTSFSVLVKKWELARLFGWTVLDQRPGVRRSTNNIASNVRRYRRRATNAQRAGDIMLASQLDDLSQEPVEELSSSNGSELQLNLALIRIRGGFSNLVRTSGTRQLIRKAAGQIRALSYVYHIVDFLCRYDQ